MLFVSLFLWVTGYIFSIGCSSAMLNSLGLNFVGDAFARALSLLSYVCVALVLNHLYLFERRVPYMPHIFLWLVSIHVFLQPDYVVSLSLLILLLSLAQLLSCTQERGQERAVYAAFATLSFSSLFLLQFVYLIPLFFAYLWIAKILCVRNFFAALLGVVTPYWLLLGIVFVFPSLSGLLIPVKFGLLKMFVCTDMAFSLQAWVTLLVEIFVMLVALVVFFASSIPAKPLLRRRMLFLFLVNGCLFLLSFVVPQDYSLLLAWRLPGVAIMATYVFSMRVTRLSNIYFIVINILWLIIAALCLWII